MAPPRVLLVTGSRALCVGRGGSRESERQRRAALLGRLLLSPLAALAAGIGYDVREAALERARRDEDNAMRARFSSGLRFDLTRCDLLTVERAVTRRRGWLREVLVLLSSGAAFTARCTRERGLVVTVETCPAEYGAERDGR